jgi:enoyl-CoA hydratase
LESFARNIESNRKSVAVGLDRDRQIEGDGKIMAGTIRVEQQGSLGWLILSNPERHNAVSLEMWEQTIAAVERFNADPSVRLIVVRGEGDKSFVSGADISKFDSERAGEAAVNRYEEATESAYSAVEQCPKPTIAMIHGYCIGGGLNLALCCDLRLASEDAKFAIPAARLGLGYGYTRIKRLLDLVSPAAAKEIFYTARQFSAREALTMGLVNQVVPSSELAAYVEDYAERIVENAPLTIGSIKLIIAEAMKDPSERDLARCDELVRRCFESRDYEEGRNAFKEKRKPRFTGG